MQIINESPLLTISAEAIFNVYEFTMIYLVLEKWQQRKGEQNYGYFRIVEKFVCNNIVLQIIMNDANPER